MAKVISKKALHEFLLVKCKEQTIELTKRFKLRGKAELTFVINEGGSNEDILLMRTSSMLSKTGKITTFLKREAKQSVLIS